MAAKYPNVSAAIKWQDTVIAAFKLILSKSKMCTDITVLFLFGDDRLQGWVDQVGLVTSKTKVTNIL